MPRALIALGANLGDPRKTLETAVRRLTECPHVFTTRVSSFHATRPVGGPAGQDEFVNAAMLVETSLSPEALHAELVHLEDAAGRQRETRWGPRTLDLDLLLYDEVIPGEDVLDAPEFQGRLIATPRLLIPHPRMACRRFVLEPAAEVAPEMVHPLLDWTVERLLAHLNQNQGEVILLGPEGNPPDSLARAIAVELGKPYTAELRQSATSPGDLDSSGLVPPPQIQFPDHAPGMLAGSDKRDPKTAIRAWTVDQALGEDLDPREIKLLVVLDDWEALIAMRLNTSTAPQDPLRLPLLTFAAHYQQSPLLCAGRGDFAIQLQEITAALIAMK